MTTETNDKLDEKFESSFDVNASVPDPISTGSNARPADKSDGEKASKSLTKAQMISGITHAAYKQSHPELTALYREFFKLQGKNIDAGANRATIKSGGLKEDIDSIFEGADLSEEFKDKANTIFEAAVNTAIVAETARLEEEFEVRLEEAAAEQIAVLESALETMVDHVAEQWMETNALAVETGIRGDIAESFMAQLRTVFVEHHIEIPEDKVDVVESLASEVADLQAKLDEQNLALSEATELLSRTRAQAVLATVTEGLTESQAAQLATLSEDLDTSDVARFEEKLRTIKESFVAKKAPVSGTAQLNEEVTLEEHKTVARSSDDAVASVLAHLNAKKK